MKSRFAPRYGRSRLADVSNAVDVEDVVRSVKKINRRVRREWSIASSAAREAHLRSLMGLPAVRSLSDDRGQT